MLKTSLAQEPITIEASLILFFAWERALCRNIKKIDNNIELKISDNGSGIPTSLKEKIFEPNFTTKNKGTGLGLSIIKKLIDSYNGKIGFTSKAGKTIFKITVPTT